MIIYQNPNLPEIRITLNEGSEALEYASSTSQFNIPYLSASTGKMRLLVEAANSSSPDEYICFNGDTLAGPGDIFQSNLGAWADYMELEVYNIQSNNSLTIGTGDDLFGIHLAVLTSNTTNHGLDVTLTPINPPLVIPANGGLFQFIAAVQRTQSPQISFWAWARIKNPDGAYTLPTLGPVQISPPVGVQVSRSRTQTVPGSWAAGVYTYLGYANPSLNYPAVDSSFFTFTKTSISDGGPWITEASCSGEPFPGEAAVSSLPETYTLCQVSPNPFNASTTISFQLTADCHVNLKVCDTAGRLVSILVDGWREAGKHEMTFDGSKLASGVYLFHLEANKQVALGKIVLLK